MCNGPHNCYKKGSWKGSTGGSKGSESSPDIAGALRMPGSHLSRSLAEGTDLLVCEHGPRRMSSPSPLPCLSLLFYFLLQFTLRCRRPQGLWRALTTLGVAGSSAKHQELQSSPNPHLQEQCSADGERFHTILPLPLPSCCTEHACSG